MKYLLTVSCNYQQLKRLAYKATHGTRLQELSIISVLRNFAHMFTNTVDSL